MGSSISVFAASANDFLYQHVDTDGTTIVDVPYTPYSGESSIAVWRDNLQTFESYTAGTGIRFNSPGKVITLNNDIPQSFIVGLSATLADIATSISTLTSGFSTLTSAVSGLSAGLGTMSATANTLFANINGTSTSMLASSASTTNGLMTKAQSSKVDSLPASFFSGAYTDLSGKPTIKRVDVYSGTTNGSGAYTVTFGTAFSATPNVQGNIIGGSDTQSIIITNRSTTGFTVTVRNRTDVLGLLPSYSNVSGATVDVVVTAQ